MEKIFVPTGYHPFTARALGAVANHEIKGFSYVALVELGGGTAWELAKEVAESSGVENVVESVRKYPSTYEINGFATKQNGMYDPINEDAALPVTGTLLEWTDAHDLSLIPFISGNYKNRVSPVNKLQIIEGLLNGYQPWNIELPGYHPSSNRHETGYLVSLRGLVRSGMVDVVESPNRFKILDPEYRGTRLFDKLSPETKAVYGVLSRAKEVSPRRSWAIDDLVTLGEDQLLFTGINRSHARVILSRAVSNKYPKAFGGTINKIPLLPKVYSIAPDMEEAATDLLERVKQVDTYGKNTPGRSYRKSAVEFAFEALQDVTTANRVVLRGMEHSRHVK